FSRRARLVLIMLVAGTVPAASGERPVESVAAAVTEAPHASPRGRLLVLPGVYNTRFQLNGFVEQAEALLPGFDVEVRRWGTPLLPLRNLRAHDRNLVTAETIAAEIAEWRREHPQDPFYLMGYSGGGGMATLIASALPDGVAIDRLILVAPAISPSYPLDRDVFPHVSEVVVNYASDRDLQVGWGTRTFGTIDRQYVDSAGAVGFSSDDPKLVEWHWSERDREIGHRGNHIADLNEGWRASALIPAIEPAANAESLDRRWP